MINAKQIQVIERLKQNMLSRHSEYEIKEYATRENEYFVQVVITVGLPNDEGTLAEVLCRDSATFHIGVRGGVERVLLSTNGKSNFKRARGLRNALAFY